MKKIAIVGAGAWGTALSIVLGRANPSRPITLWARENDVLLSLQKERENCAFLPGFRVPSQVEVTGDFATALRDAEIVIGAMPAAHARAVYAAMLPFLAADVRFVSATKGLEPETLLRMTEVIAQVKPATWRSPVAALSGPSFAKEVARGNPTAIVAASTDDHAAKEIQSEFSGPTLRVYTNHDVIGVELGGALKNIIAIASGVAEGLGLGHSTTAALITRGLAEMTRLGTRLGARRETLAGLAGMGDLVLTCTGGLSRNRFVGLELASGKKIEEILASMRMVAEGIGTTAAARTLAQRAAVEMPITEQMFAVLHQGKPPQEALRELMERRLKSESDGEN